MKRKLIAVLATAAILAVGACSTTPSSEGSASGGSGSDTDSIVLGFAQVGAESGWRTANTKSIQETAKAEGIELKFSDAQQKQENQITAIRGFIQQKVDVIAFSPVVESGWDTVLNEAKDAGIPVILTDRAVDADENLYVTFLGSDFVKEGEEAGNWAVKEFADKEEIKYVTLEGTTGASAATDRDTGWDNIISKEAKFKELGTQTGDFTRSGGKQVMEAFLKSNPEIDLVYAHNDDMGLGAVEAIEAAGKKPGEDIKIITVDAVKDGMTALSEGKLNFIVECNPLLGPQLMQIVKDVKAGKEIERRVVAEEGTFTQEEAKAALPDRQY